MRISLEQRRDDGLFILAKEVITEKSKPSHTSLVLPKRDLLLFLLATNERCSLFCIFCIDTGVIAYSCFVCV